MRRGLIRSAHSANFKTGLFDGGDASRPLTIRAIDLDQCDRIAFRFAFRKERKHTRNDRGVSSSAKKRKRRALSECQFDRLRCNVQSVGNIMATATLITLPKAKPAQEKQRKSEIETSWAGRVPYLKPGRYADGMPLHEVDNPTGSGRARTCLISQRCSGRLPIAAEWDSPRRISKTHRSRSGKSCL